MSGKPGEAPLDPWSIVHFGSGLAVGLVLRSPLAALAALVLYEGFEGILRRVKRHGGKGLFEHESWANIAYDVLFGMMGWVFAQGMPGVSLGLGGPELDVVARLLR